MKLIEKIEGVYIEENIVQITSTDCKINEIIDVLNSFIKIYNDMEESGKNYNPNKTEVIPLKFTTGE